MSLNAMAGPAAREPGPLVTLVRSRTVANVDSMVIWSWLRERAVDLRVCVVDGVRDVGVQHGLGAPESCCFGVSRRGSARRSPSASARACRKRWLSVSSCRMRSVAT